MSSSSQGDINTAIGAYTLTNFPSANDNTAIGGFALEYDTTGHDNTAVGAASLQYNYYANFNTAVGSDALESEVSGSNNTAMGYAALTENASGNNTAIGCEAMENSSTGQNNIALGYVAGINLTTGSYNIDIGNSGAANDYGITRIGSQYETQTYITGIRGVQTGLSGAIAAVIDGNGQLGTVSSSRRIKEDIHSMGDMSDRLLKLRPVTFRYKKPRDNGEKPLEYGLIARKKWRRPSRSSRCTTRTDSPRPWRITCCRQFF